MFFKVRSASYSELMQRVPEASKDESFQKFWERVVLMVQKYGELPVGLVVDGKISFHQYVFDVTVEDNIIYLEDFHK